jgi:pantothenate kinase
VPKLKLNDTEQKNRVVNALIKKNMVLLGVNDEELAIKARFTRRTLQNRRNNPESYTLGELRRICTALKLTDEEKAQLL